MAWLSQNDVAAAECVRIQSTSPAPGARTRLRGGLFRAQLAEFLCRAGLSQAGPQVVFFFLDVMAHVGDELGYQFIEPRVAAIVSPQEAECGRHAG